MWIYTKIKYLQILELWIYTKIYLQIYGNVEKGSRQQVGTLVPAARHYHISSDPIFSGPTLPRKYIHEKIYTFIISYQCVTVPKMLDDTDTDTFFRY